MKSLLRYFVIAVVSLVAVNCAKAGEVSLSTQALNTQSSWIYTDNSDRLQVNFDGSEDRYFFASVERLQLCPYYCPENFSLFGGGIGKNLDFRHFELFGQIGAFYVTNDQGKQQFNERIYYYMVNKFGKASFESYETANGDVAIGGAIGVNIPMTENSGIKFYYRIVQMEVNFIARFTNGRSYWHDPTNVKLTGIGVGGYWNF